ncbi:hypothetical protein [Streptomyces niveus]|uniref:hypothetical protein n=1 Tax=Streptomyces niveus TaxID=193462 RepID=UPI003446CF02
MARARAHADGDIASLTLLDRALGDRGLSDQDVELVRAVLTDTGAKDLVNTKIDRLTADSARHLAAVTADPTVREHLGALFHAVAADVDSPNASILALDTPSPP